MDPYKLNEPVITALQARLAADLPAALTVIRARLTGDEASQLINPARVLDYAPPPSLLTDFPTIGILDESTDLEDDTGSSATGRHDLGVIVYIANPDPRLLAWHLRRYAQAVAKVALNGRVLGTGSDAGAWGTGALRPFVKWGPTLQDEDNPRQIMSWVIVRLWARREEL